MLPLEFLSANADPRAALLILDGLGVCCFNDTDPRHKFWEVAFLRYSDHSLKITVGTDEYNIAPDVKTIDILTNNGSSHHYDKFKKGYLEIEDEFSRVSGNRYDFRWVPNFVGHEIPHGTFKGLKTRAMNRDRVGVTLVRIPHSLFYTDEVTDNYVIFSPKELDDPSHGLIFGPTNEVIGALLLADQPAGLKIVIGDGSGGACDSKAKTITNCVIDLSQEGGILEVKIENMDDPKRQLLKDRDGFWPRAAERRQHIPKHLKVKSYLEGDFKYYYEVIDVDGEQLTLWAEPKDPEMKNRLGDCNLVRVETEDITSLENLVDYAR